MMYIRNHVDAEDIFHALKGKKGKKTRDGYLCHCPAHSDENPSLHVTQKGNKILIKCFAGCSQESVIEALRARGLWPEPSDHDNIGQPQGIPLNWRGKKLTSWWAYTSDKGEILGYAARYDGGDGKEVIPFFVYDVEKGWCAGIGNFKDKRPLYKLHKLVNDREKTVVICEGEKAADAAQLLLGDKFVTTASQGGSNAAARADWGALKDRKVIIWPDADQAGIKYASAVIELIKKAGAEVAGVVDLETLGFEMGSGKDAADLEKPLPEPLPLVSVEDFARKYAHHKQNDNEVVLTPMTEVTPEEVRWVWKGYIPQGKLTLIEGDPGTGKTWVCLAIAARVTLEGHNVIYMTYEDDPADTLRPRLEAMEADLKRLYLLRGKRVNGILQHITLRDQQLLEEAIVRVKPRLLVVDPLQGFVGGDIDLYRANEVRARLAGVIKIAASHNCAVLVVRHLNKSSHANALYRGLGSIDLSAAARSVILCGIDADGNRAIVPIKHNLSQSQPPAQGFEIVEGRFYWKGEVNITAEDLLRVQDESEKSGVEEAAEFLQSVLEQGPVPAEDVLKQARKLGITQISLRRAKKKMQVRSYRQGGKKRGAGKWYWALPPEEDHNFKDDHFKDDHQYNYPDDHLKNDEKHQQNQLLMQDFLDDHMIILKNPERGKDNKDLEANFKMIIKNIKDDHLEDDHLKTPNSSSEKAESKENKNDQGDFKDDHVITNIVREHLKGDHLKGKNADKVPVLCQLCKRLDFAEGIFFCAGCADAERPLPAFAFSGEKIEQCKYFLPNGDGGKNQGMKGGKNAVS